VLVAALAGVTIYTHRPGTIVITTEPGANISIANTPGGAFTKIGTGTAKYSSRKIPSDVYVMVTTGSKKTMAGASLQRGKTQDLNLRLSNVVPAKVLVESSLSSMFIEGPLVQGIVPGQYSLTSFNSTNPTSTIRPEFAGLPYIKKIVWYDKDNFIYNTLSEGVGRFIAGKDNGNRDIGNGLSGVGLDTTTSDTPEVQLQDFARSKDKPLVLVSQNNLFLSNNMGTNLRSISRITTPPGSINQLAVNNDYIFRFYANKPSDYEEDSGRTADVYQYNYDGQEINHLHIDGNYVSAIASLKDTVYAITPTGLHTVKNGAQKKVPLYFQYGKDLIEYKDSVLFLADDGLWRITDDGSAQLLYSFSSNGVGLSGSLSISDGQVIFGSTSSPKTSNVTTKMFTLSF